MTRAALAKIHIAKKELGYSDDLYRDVLERITGHRSSAKMTDRQHIAVIKEFKRLGWKPIPGGKKQNGGGAGEAGKARDGGKNKWREPSDNPMHRKIWALGKELDRHGYWKQTWKVALRKFVKSETGVDDIDWLETRQASNVIEALKSILRRM